MLKSIFLIFACALALSTSVGAQTSTSTTSEVAGPGYVTRAIEVTRAAEAVTSDWTAPPAVKPVTPVCVCPPAQTSYSAASNLGDLGAVRDAVVKTLETNPVNYFRPVSSRPWMSSQAIWSGKDWAPACKNFIGTFRQYGKWGDVIRNDMTPEKYPNLFSNTATTDMAKVCPTFNSMTPPQKEGFWIYFTAATAMAESSCNEKVVAPAMPGRVGKGLFTLEPGHEQSYPTYATAKDQCKRGDSNSPETSIRCFLKMENYYLGVRHHVLSLRPNEARGIAGDKDFYFQVHFASGGGGQAAVFQRLMKGYNQCQQL